jgi:hypothetical protein
MTACPAEVAGSPDPARVERHETLVKGRPAQVKCIALEGQTFLLSGGGLTTVSLEDEWYEDVRDPETVVRALQACKTVRADLFTFWQRIPEYEPKYRFPIHWEELAVLSVDTYEHWFERQIKSRTRGLIRKAEKEGVEARETVYDDAFVRGMTAIFNETPVRQGRKFWHYGKDFDTVKRQFSRYVHRECMIGAYYQGEMIGFMMLGDAGRFGLTGQIISAVRHRDKAPNNLLIAKAVEVCARRRLPHLCYLFWSGDSLGEFKRRNGFEPRKVPRYFVPLTGKGRLAMRLGIHRGWKALIPAEVKASLKVLRTRWYGWTCAE